MKTQRRRLVYFLGFILAPLPTLGRVAFYCSLLPTTASLPNCDAWPLCHPPKLEWSFSANRDANLFFCSSFLLLKAKLACLIKKSQRQNMARFAFPMPMPMKERRGTIIVVVESSSVVIHPVK
eukprot:scaffold8111_cov206-Skeletonema_marinoi.AAC.4